MRWRVPAVVATEGVAPDAGGVSPVKPDAEPERLSPVGHNVASVSA